MYGKYGVSRLARCGGAGNAFAALAFGHTQRRAARAYAFSPAGENR